MLALESIELEDILFHVIMDLNVFISFENENLNWIITV